MKYHVLGPVTVIKEETPVRLGGPKQRAVLGALLSRPNRIVTTDQLIDVVWGEEVPEAARHTLHVYVSELRRALGGAIEREGPGYRLTVDPQELDALLFETLARQGHAALTADPKAAKAHLEEALGLWTGTPYAGLAEVPFFTGEISRLEELRIGAVEDRLEAELATGNHAGVVAELELLIREHPFRERLRGQLMLALYRSGRQADALRLFAETRRMLADELGVDPSPELQDLELKILQQDPALLATGPEAARSTGVDPEPMQLPTGRVVFLFAEVVGAQNAWDEGPDQVAVWLGDYFNVFGERVKTNGGFEFLAAGDQRGAVFAGPDAAIAAAVDAQWRLRRLVWEGATRLSVRMAIHAGDARYADGRYMGPALAWGLDLLASAQGGQILVSSTAARATSLPLPDGAVLRDRGMVWLARSAGSEAVYDIVHPALPSDFAAMGEMGARESLFDAHIPFDRRLALAQGRALPDRTSGAVLFADMSKFTALTDSLVESMGPQRGAEEISRLVNAALAKVIEQVHRYGGSVIGFAGDGVTCWFDGDNGRRATAAALAAQLLMSGAKAVTTEAAPAIKIVVTAGLARRFLVGVPRIQRFDVIAGGLLDRMAAAERLARPGEVLVGSEVVGWLQDRLQVLDWRHHQQGTEAEVPELEGEWFAVVTGSPDEMVEPVAPVVVPPLPHDLARAWVNPLLYQRIERGEGELVSELRQVVSLFVRFGGIQYDFDNEAGSKLGDYIEWVQKLLVPLGGFITQVVVGDKGSYLLASFGAPLAHEDDILRAVRAGEELVRIPPWLDFITETAAGISEGKMHAGVFGRSGRKSFEVLGGAANRAARLMQSAAAGQILVDGSVAERASASFRFRRRAPDSDVYELAGPQPVTGDPVPKGKVTDIVGRDDERRRLQKHLDLLLEGEPGLVVIEGPPGIGKSRLLVDLKEQAEALAIPTFAAAASAIDSLTPFHAWKPIFEAVLQIGPTLETSAVEAALHRHLANAPRLLELLPLLNPVLPIELAENEYTARIPADSRIDNALEVMVACLQRPVGTLAVMLLILDDVQWLDSGSWSLLEAVRRQHSSLLTALATRPADTDGIDGPSSWLPGELQASLRQRPEALIPLRPLGASDMTEMIRLYLAVDEVPPGLTSVVMDRAEGNPFFAQELVDSLQQRGLIRVEGGVCRLVGDPEQIAAAFPERVEKLLISRLDHLPPDHRTTLLVASVLGRTFSPRMLADVHPRQIDEGTLRSELEVLAGLGMVEVEPDGGEASYRFRHGLTQQAAAELLSTSLRRDIQARAATWIEANQAANLAPYWPTLARFWDAAGEVGKALDYLELAAVNATTTGADEEAISFYSRALNLAGAGGISNERVGRWHLRLGELYVHRQREDVTKGRDNLVAGLAAFGLAPPRSAPWLILAILWQLVRQVVYRLRGGTGQAPEATYTSLVEASRAYERLVEVYYISGETLPSLYASLRALNLAEAAGPSPELTRGWATFGALLGFVPLRGWAARYLHRALESVDPASPAADAWASLVAGFYYSGLGEWDQALPLSEKVVSLSREIGDARRLEDGLSILMMHAYLRGDLSRGLGYAEELEERAVSRHADRPLAYGLQGRAYCLLGLGRAEEASEAIDRLEQVHARDPRPADQSLISDTYGLMALAELHRGNLHKALATTEVLLRRVAKESPTNFSTIAAYSAPAEVYITAWRRTKDDRTMLRMAARSLRVLKRYSRVFPIGRPRWLLWQGVLDAQRGRPQRALDNLNASLAEATSLGLRIDQIRALGELAALMGDDDPVAADYRRRAADIAEGLDITSQSRNVA